MNKQKGSVLIIALSSLIALSLIAIGTVMFLNNRPSKNLVKADNNNLVQQNITDNIVTPIEQANITPIPSAPVVKNSNSSSSKITPPAVISCSDMSCFLQAAKTCTPAQGIVAIYDQPVFTFLLSGKTETQIKKGDNGKCIFYQKFLELSVKYSDKLVQLLLGQGKTMDEIKLLEKTGNQEQQFAVGKESTCVMTIDDLVKKISEDIDSMNGNINMTTEHPGCTGSLYDGTEWSR